MLFLYPLRRVCIFLMVSVSFTCIRTRPGLLTQRTGYMERTQKENRSKVYTKIQSTRLAFLRLHFQLHFLLDWKTILADRKKAILSMGWLAGEIYTLSTIRYAWYSSLAA